MGALAKIEERLRNVGVIEVGEPDVDERGPSPWVVRRKKALLVLQ